jgi:alkylhydroperoxidase family enzyme
MPYVLRPLEAPLAPVIESALERYPKNNDGYVIKLFRVFANSIRFLTSKGVLNHLDKESPLSLKEREIVILRVTANNDCEYEWGVHVAVFADAAGLSAEQVAATRLADAEANCWSKEERLLLKGVDELCANAKISGATLEGFQERWTLEQQLEILALCGSYHTVSFVANTSCVEPEDFGSRFPAS